MRLVCPSCSSEYEVDDAAIGPRGRVVRCANCDAEWFQAPAVGAVSPVAADIDVAAAPEPAPTPQSAPEPAPEPAVEERPVIDFSALRSGLNAPANEAPTYSAERDAPPVVDAPEERIHFDEPPVIEATATAVAAAEPKMRARRRSEPDELAASLREAGEQKSSGGSGAFLAGFATVTLLSLILIAVYVKAPDIAALAPAAEGPLTAYANAVDQGRLALAQLIRG